MENDRQTTHSAHREQHPSVPYRVVRSGIQTAWHERRRLRSGGKPPDDGKAVTCNFERVHSEMICADLTDELLRFHGLLLDSFPPALGPPLVREAPRLFQPGEAITILLRSGTNGGILSKSIGKLQWQILFTALLLRWVIFIRPIRREPSFNSQISCHIQTS